MSVYRLRRAAAYARAEWEPERHGASQNAARVHLAVAAWLDTEAAHVGSHDCEAHCEPGGCPQVRAALSVARAYLGEGDPS